MISNPESPKTVYYWEKKIRPNTQPEIPEIPLDLSLWRRPLYQTLLKDLDISIATAGVALDLLKALAILSDTTVRRSELIKKT